MAETQANLPPPPENLPTQTIPLYPFTPTSTLGELIACFRHRCPGYNRQSYPYDTATDPVPPIVNNGVREATTTTSGSSASAADTKSRVGFGVRFHAQPGMTDVAVDEFLSARRPGVPLPPDALSAIAGARRRHNVAFRDETRQTKAFHKEVFEILNTILDNAEELLQETVLTHPSSFWSSLERDTQHGSADGGLGCDDPLSYHISCEDKTAFVALSAAVGESGVFEQIQRLAGEDGRMGPNAIGKIAKATKIAKMTRQILQHAMIHHPELIVLGAYTQFMFLRIIPPSETLVETQIFVSRIYRRYPTGAHWIQATDDLQCDLTKVSITTALLAVSLRRVNGEVREWETAYVWPSTSDIRAWRAARNRRVETIGATGGGGGDDADDGGDAGGSGEGGGTGGEDDGPRSRSWHQGGSDRGASPRRSSKHSGAQSHDHSNHEMALIIDMPVNLGFPQDWYVTNVSFDSNDSFRLYEVTCRPPPPIARSTWPLPSQPQKQPLPSVSGRSNLSSSTNTTPSSSPVASPVSSKGREAPHSSPISTAPTSLSSSLMLRTIDGKTPGSATPLLKLQFSAVLGRGHLGQVFRATLRDELGAHDVAVKVVVPGRFRFARDKRDSEELTFEEAEASIMHEARVYHALSDYQGSLIPKTFGLWKGRLIDEGSFPAVYGDLDAYLLILECLETGSSPSVEEVESLYRALHAAGVVHGDACLRHYRDGRLLDLERAILSPALGSVPGTEHSQKTLDIWLREEYDHPPNDQDRLKKWEELAQEELEDVRSFVTL